MDDIHQNLLYRCRSSSIGGEESPVYEIYLKETTQFASTIVRN